MIQNKLKNIKNKSMKTLVIGASVNPERYSNKAIQLLKANGHQVVAIGNREGIAHGIQITKIKESFTDIDTVTLYINPRIQSEYYQYILDLHPRRIIFNPGTENPELSGLAEENGILTENACTLVLLNLKQF